MKPLLSIVIANYNYGRFLEQAIVSILDQNIPEVELLVVDGGSTDNSVEIIKRYAGEGVEGQRSPKISYWISEKDKGQSDAFNKGFAKARGKYLTWLNADDIMTTGCLARVIAEMKAHPECSWFSANTYRFTEAGNVVDLWWGPRMVPS